METDDTFKIELGHNLRDLRKKAGYKNATDFADALGMQYTRYIAYELGRASMRLDAACMICEALNCSLDVLVGRHQEKAIDPSQQMLNDYYTELSDEGKGVAVRQLEGMTYVYK